MLKLDRASINAPACLAEYDYHTQTWDDFRSACKKQLRFALVQLQGIPDITTAEAAEYGVRCAYCESAIYHEGHIEHFRRKSKKHPNGYPALTFEWSNFFLACGSDEHCGHYKDRPTAPLYDADQLVKPDEHDPEYYLYFHSSGEVRVRGSLSAEEQHRAAETIRVFGLDNGALIGARANAVRSYRKIKDQDIEELASWDEDDRNEYFLYEIESTRWQPYATTIKHFLQTRG
ncbi:hypothetical protein AZH11_21105 [Pseudomonas simiae]|nr:hypothetical protein AZH11_21105 [Pseudomonas simiae]